MGVRVGLSAGKQIGAEATMEIQSDAELVAQARRGFHDAFGELVMRHYRLCVNVATLILSNRAEAMDEVQTACYKALVHLDQYQGDGGFGTWMCRIVENECRMRLRVKSRTPLLHIDSVSDKDTDRQIELRSRARGPEENAINNELRAVLHRELHRVPTLFREVLLLRDVQELPIADVAERLNITVSAAKSRLLRARGELRDRCLRPSASGGRKGAAARQQPC